MENAQLIGLSRQIALMRQMDVVANNVANVNTTGFKAENILFREYLMPVARDRDFPTPDQQLSYVEDWGTVHDMTNGAVVETGNPLDVALEGEGFLTVQSPQGERWTRAGSLQIDPTGTLVNLDGYPVLSDLGQIHFEPGETDIAIDAGGNVSGSGGQKGHLRIVEFADPQQAAREGNNLYSGGSPVPAANTRLVQGAIEKSNVSGVSEITQLIRVQRAYETVASLMQRQDDIQRSAIQRLGSLNA
jgi:flagellar basal-body rod protein FlgF